MLDADKFVPNPRPCGVTTPVVLSDGRLLIKFLNQNAIQFRIRKCVNPRVNDLPREMFMTPESPLRVLCVMRDPVDQLAMQDYSWILGWDLTICRDLEQCIDLTASRQVDLIVSDLYQGPPCGLEMVRSVRVENAANESVPALLLTDQKIPEKAIVKADEIGAAVLRRKPLLLSDLKMIATQLTGVRFNNPGGRPA